MSNLPKNWTDDILKALQVITVAGEEMLDQGRRAISDRLDRNSPAHIAAYCGYADQSGTHLTGRVLSKAPGGGPMDHDSAWDNLANTWRRWESDEVPGVEVTVQFGGHEITVVSDEEGYYEATLPAPAGDGGLWASAGARMTVEERQISATHPVLTPLSAAAFGIISDLDDTVIHTGITSMLLAAKLTFLENAKTRKPLDGVAELYAAFQKGTVGQPVNPIFYVSSSPWNLHDLLWDFIELNEIPRGPILLRDFGLDRTKFVKEKGHGHKLRKALALLDGYPQLPFVLSGDSGQEDPTIYAELCRLRPGRVLAIYIRDVDPGVDSPLDAKVREAVEIAARHGVPMVLAPDSRAMSEHASQIGLIPAAAVPEVIAEVHKDEKRPETGEQAIKDAASSLVPGAE
ncbi:MAG: phosphatase domain-containing protein [Verrucomicrobiota bacterium]